MKTQLRAALVVFAVLTAITGVVYPFAVWAIAQAAFPHQANGSVIVRDGQAIGSDLIGQAFAEARYFHGRPSATDPSYNPASSTGSNLGPTNPELQKVVQERAEALRNANPTHSGDVPVDLVTASGSGLDPHISPAAAEFQVKRVARARGWTAERVRQIVAGCTEGRTVGVLGEPRVNVLRLNVALDENR